MNRYFKTLLMLPSLLLAIGHGVAAVESVSESRPVDARTVIVSLGGAIDLRIKQGATPSLILSGEKSDLDLVRIRQKGEQIEIDMESQWFRHADQQRRSVRAELTLPNLAELDSHGAGKAELAGFSGNALVLHLDGAGAMTASGRYRTVRANLSGAGSLTLDAGEPDRIDLDLSGVGQIVVTGRSKLLHAKLGGVGSLDARQLRADSVELDMSGLGSANVFARQAANLNLSGLGSANIAGKPAQRQVSKSGLGSVHWD